MRRQKGFTYMIALFMVATLSVVSLRAMERTLTKDRREREAELLYVGQAYRQAIQVYYQNSPGTAKKYPPDLQSLLQDARTTSLQRPLRKLYRDPITSSLNWGIVSSADGGVMGVYSLSTQQPIKVNGFPVTLFGFTGAKSYQQWQFVYQPS
jgi:type II secretory pathway pseudopilin PulG